VNTPTSKLPCAYDVIVVGAGPSGLTVANLLAQRGHNVAIFERYAAPYNLPRAGHLDHDVLRIIQEIGCLAPVLDDFFPIERVPFIGANGQMLVELSHAHDSSSSFHSGFMYQPVLEDALYENLRCHKEHAQIYQGWTVQSATQTGSAVRIHAQPSDASGEARVFESRYLIAADGSGSSIRESLGIGREDFGFNVRWLDVDVAYRPGRHVGPPAVVGDPKRPRASAPLGRHHHRFEWQLFDEESTESFLDPGTAWTLLAALGVTADDVEIVRQAVYAFEYRVAERWRDRRMLLLGDAAHTMPPCLGQGLCSGIRDSANLAWKLDLVLRGLAHDAILDTYEVERRPHVKAWCDLSLEAGELFCMTDAKKAAARDAAFENGQRPAFRPSPKLESGILSKSSMQFDAMVGDLFPQRQIRRGHDSDLFDDVVGPGFALVTKFDPRPLLTAPDLQYMQQVGMQTVWFAPDTQSDAFVDETGAYQALFARHGADAFLIRPDRYIFGAVRHGDELPRLLSKLKEQMFYLQAQCPLPLVS
jgi:3-(3-hydroxy-phenyl)propionate hydroxylase